MGVTRTLPTTGKPSTRHPHLGVWVFSLGPASPIPGDRLRLAILDERGEVVRRLEQIEGQCLDGGHVDFFLGPNCRPSVHEHPIVDITPDGKIVEVLCPDYRQSMGMAPFLAILEQWAKRWGRPEYAL